MSIAERLQALQQTVQSPTAARWSGRLLSVRGSLLYGQVPNCALGECCAVRRADGTSLRAQVVGFDQGVVTLAAFDSIHGLAPGSEIHPTAYEVRVPLDADLSGAVLRADGSVAEARKRGPGSRAIRLDARVPTPTERVSAFNPFVSGVRGIDTLCPLAHGQRIGLFAGPGVGKSTLLAMLAQNAQVDTVVIALIGERGREVREFIDDHLQGEAGARSVLVYSTSDEAPMRRLLALQTATAIAEQLRDSGQRVLLLVDSLTRVARAMRDVALAAGELPVRQGYPASVFAQLPALVERAGITPRGAITACYTVLAQGEREDDALAEEIKSLLDGHLVMREEVAMRGVRPAIDYTRSLSRLATRLWTPRQAEVARIARETLAMVARDRDLVMLGGTPSDELKRALELEPRLLKFLNQKLDEHSSLEESFVALESAIEAPRN